MKDNSYSAVRRVLTVILGISAALSLIGNIIIFADPTVPESGEQTETSEQTSLVTTDIVQTEETSSTSAITDPSTSPTTSETTADTGSGTATGGIEPTTSIITDVTATPPITTEVTTTVVTTTEAPSAPPIIIEGPSYSEVGKPLSTGDAYTITDAEQSRPPQTVSTPPVSELSPTSTSTQQVSALTSLQNEGGNKPTAGDANGSARDSLRRLSVITAIAAAISFAAFIVLKFIGR